MSQTTPASGIMASSSPNWPRDSDYYMTNIIFLVEETLFSVPRDYFATFSDIFSSTFSLPTGADHSQEGSSDKHPFHLAGVSKAEFKSLLKVMYPLYVSPDGSTPILTKDEWMAALKLATMWNFRDIRSLATTVLGATVELSPIDQILLGKQFKVPNWLIHGYHDMIKRSAMITHEEAARLGLETTVSLGHLREEIARVGPDMAYRRKDNYMDFVTRAFKDEIKEVEEANRAFDIPPPTRSPVN